MTCKRLNFLQLVRPFTDSLFLAKAPSTGGGGRRVEIKAGGRLFGQIEPPPPRLSLISLALRNAER